VLCSTISMSSSGEVVLPNSLTPLAFLPPDAALQLQVSIYIVIGSTAIMGWDMLNSVSEDYRCLVVRGLSFPWIVYALSRLSSVGYALSSSILLTVPLGRCDLQAHIATMFYVVAVASTSFLFFIRVRAVYNKSSSMTVVFGLLWLGVSVGGAVTIPTAAAGGNIGPTQYCHLINMKQYALVTVALVLLNDTLVFLAVSFRMISNSQPCNVPWRNWVEGFFRGNDLLPFSHSFAQDGQLYYLSSIITNLVVLGLKASPRVPLPYGVVFTVTNIVMTNIMACRVFRRPREPEFDLQDWNPRFPRFGSLSFIFHYPGPGQEASSGPTSVSPCCDSVTTAVETIASESETTACEELYAV